MAQPHFSEAELEALYGTVDASARARQQYSDYMKGSDVYSDFRDPTRFQSEADVLFSDRAQQVAKSTRSAADQLLASYYTRGLRGGGVEKSMTALGAGQASEVARIRGQVDVEAQQRRTANEERYMAMMQELGGLEREFIGAQQQLSRRLGEQAQWDKQYKKDFYYYSPSQEASDLYTELGMGSAEDRAAWDARRRAWKPSMGDWGTFVNSGEAEDWGYGSEAVDDVPQKWVYDHKTGKWVVSNRYSGLGLIAHNYLPGV